MSLIMPAMQLAAGPANVTEVKVYEAEEVTEVATGMIAMASVLGVLLCCVATVCLINLGLLIRCLCCGPDKRDLGP